MNFHPDKQLFQSACVIKFQLKLISSVYPRPILSNKDAVDQKGSVECIQLSDYLIKEMEIDMFLDKCLTGCS